MTTKLTSFKSFLQKKVYTPKGIKPCPPGKHRHWGRTDCHPVQQKHKKHLKQGIDLHHGMDAATGQIPEGIVPPNAHEFYDDGHHSAKAHGEHTGSKGGICKPGTYKGQPAPFHRHPGADYCHPVGQKHGGSSPSKLTAQQWHNTHMADIQAAWYEFNESQGLPQFEAVADTVSDAVSPYDEDADEVYNLDELDAAEEKQNEESPSDEKAIDSIESPGSVDNPYDGAVNDIIKLKTDYLVDHPAKTYKIQNIYEDEFGTTVANIEHTETGLENVIALNNDNIESIEKWQPEGEPVDKFNPHEFALGSTFTVAEGGTVYTITSVDPENNKIYYNAQAPESDSMMLNYQLDKFNEWVTSMYTGDENFKVNPPPVPDGLQSLTLGDAVSESNIGFVKIGMLFNVVNSEGNTTAQAKITEIEGTSEFPVYVVDYDQGLGTTLEEFIPSGETTSYAISDGDLIDGNHVVAENPASLPPNTEKYLNDDALADLPTVGTTITNAGDFEKVMPGTSLISPSGAVINIVDNQADSWKLDQGVLSYTLEGSSKVQNSTWENLAWSAGLGEGGYTIGALPEVASTAKNKGYELGGKVTASNFMQLPVGLAFAYNTQNAMGTATVTDVKGTGIYVDLKEPSGAEYKNQFINELTQLSSSSETGEGFKIVALPDGTAVQHVPEPTGATTLENKHGLDKGTKLTIKQYDGNLVSATIVKTHKTKAGQNYTIEYEDGSTTKIASGTILVGDETVGAGQTGVVIAHEGAIYKPGQEPEETVELTLPPLGSEPGNWDEVLTKVDGAMGYQEGGVFKHKQTGDKFYIKFSSSGNDQQVKSEALASQLYALCGIRTLSPSLIEFEGKTVLKSNWNENLEKIKISDMANEPGIMNSFVIDAWLANWDVVGPQHDNMQKSGNQIVKIDSGGALKFGGAGGAKSFTGDVKELESMRDPDLGKVAHKVFENITSENLKSGAQVLKSVKDSHIDSIVDASQIPNKEEMKATLKARRDDILNKIGGDVEAAGHPGQHKHAGYSGWHSKSQAHSGHLKEANAAHKALKEGPYKIGGTQEEGQNIWSAIASTRNSTIQEFAKKAQAVNFLSPNNDTYQNQKNVKSFLEENGMEDVFNGAFSGWQGGGTGNAQQNATIRAALFNLKGIADLDHVEDSEKSFWNNIIGANPDQIESGWNKGMQHAIAIIPYVVLSQQYTKANIASGKDGKVNEVYRGYQDKSSYSKNNTNVATLMLDALEIAKGASVETKEVRVPNDGISGYSTNKGTADKFSQDGSGQGVVVSKSGLNIEDVLINFNAFSGAHTGEKEILIDSSAVRVFSPDEIRKTK